MFSITNTIENRMHAVIVAIAILSALVVVAGALRVARIPSDVACPHLQRQRSMGIAMLVIGSVGFVSMVTLALCKGGFGKMDCGSRVGRASSYMKKTFGAGMWPEPDCGGIYGPSHKGHPTVARYASGYVHHGWCPGTPDTYDKTKTVGVLEALYPPNHKTKGGSG
jgi:hypothetical protein